MRYLLSLFLFVSFTTFGQIGQIVTPTKWTHSVKPEVAKVGDEVEITFHAKINDGWNLYAAEMDPDIGPLILEFTFSDLKDLKLVGKPKPTQKPKVVYEDIWESNTLVYAQKVDYVQKVKITGDDPSLNANLFYQSCQDDGVCVNGDDDFAIAFKVDKTVVETTVVAEVEEVVEEEELVEEDAEEEEEGAVLVSDSENDTYISQGSEKPVSPVDEKSDAGLWKFLLIAFGAGFASMLMPCIYPIMPMTISFFTKQKGGKLKALFYGLSIMFIFALMGLITMFLGASFLNALSTHWVPNLIFFLLFVVFGISLLGAFEIVLPSSTVNKIDRLGDKGGLIGIFFMALTLVVVSFSCTVPFVGSLLIGAAGGAVAKPLYGMLAFGLPYALVFGGLALFPQYLKRMPKSGGWLDELKVVFGLLEFALALKFLSNIDLAYHWGMIHRNIFLMIWIVIAVIIGLYILGFMRMPNDQKVGKYGPVRVGFAILFFAFAAYMVPGVTNKPLVALSGILPPLPVQQVASDAPKPDLMRPIPHGLWGFNEIDDAMAYSAEVGKPILIDFTGYACANCRKMEEHVWSKPDVLKSLKDDFIIASLYVDDKRELPEDRHYVSEYDNKLKKTIGSKNLDYQMSKYNSNAQPYYIIVNAEGEMLIDPVAYTSYEGFREFLERGKQGYRNHLSAN